MKNKAIIVLCAVSISLSLAALCISYFRCEPITMDWMGVLVGVLSFLVTLLLGWQIYTLIDIQKIQKDVKRNKEEANLNMERRIAQSHHALWMFYQGRIEGHQQDFGMLLHSCLQNGIAAIFHFAQCGEYQMAGDYCFSLASVGELVVSANVDKRLIQSEIQVLLSVQNPNKIQGYGELLSILHRCLK